MFWQVFVAFGIMLGFLMGVACKLEEYLDIKTDGLTAYNSRQRFLPPELATDDGKLLCCTFDRNVARLLRARVTALLGHQRSLRGSIQVAPTSSVQRPSSRP